MIGNDSTARELALTARPIMRLFVIPGSNKCHCYSGNCHWNSSRSRDITEIP